MTATTIRIGINGFGRMGRLVVRALQHHPGLELVHVNETAGDLAAAAHLLEFDTVHGRYPGSVAHDDDRLLIDGRPVGFSQVAEPGDIRWDAAGVDLVIEATGKWKTTEAIDAATHHVVTAASCTTNCLAPVVKVLHEQIGIERGAITTIHDVTNTQVIVDAPHKDLRRARSALNSLIPTSTGSATAITLIYPELAGRLNGIAVRVPLLNASLTDCVFTMDRDVTVDEVNGLLRTAADGELHGILGFEDRPLVSADFVNDPRSGIVDGPSTMVIDGRMVKVLVWYDNETGYVHRMAELAALVGASLRAD
jgi:glyceraldehyde 3-phosphate dehydrogenase